MSEELRSFSMDFFSLKGKVAIVTGGNKGLGQAYAIALAKAGADVVIPTHGKEWDETRKLIEDTGRQVTFIQGDITSREDRENIIKRIYERMKHDFKEEEFYAEVSLSEMEDSIKKHYLKGKSKFKTLEELIDDEIKNEKF